MKEIELSCVEGERERDGCSRSVINWKYSLKFKRTVLISANNYNSPMAAINAGEKVRQYLYEQ